MIGVQVDGPEAVRSAVAAEIERGADVIKLFPTGGVLGSGSHGFDVTMSAEELAAAVDEAHHRGVLVGAHIHGEKGIEMSLDAGIDTIEHATAITASQARRCVAQGVALVPTLAAGDVLQDHRDSLPSDLLERAAEVGAVQADGIKTAIAEGARVLAGTDAGTPFNPAGGLVREMVLLADLGLGNLGAIAAATSLTAETLRMEDLGMIAPGKLADLVLVDGDPAADLQVLAAPRIVVQGGIVR
jgi:imidazolonepropionase-like amidohydrolase